MKIVFFNKKTGEEFIYRCPWDDPGYFVMKDGKVYCDNGATYESQSSVVSFENFVKERPDVGWRVSE